MSSILTVSQLNKYIAFKLKSDVKLKGVAVKGEVFDLSVNYKSGHMYFSLKDSEALVKCVMFSTQAAKLRFSPENGMSVLAVGNVELYERCGVYQMIVSELQPLGAGAAQLGLEQLKRRLADAGVFDTSVKKKIPRVPKKLAIVTSPTGAALQDILNILGRRYPLVSVEVYSALVQGVGAPDSLCAALKKADSSGADTIILARGGGSDDDLSAFNSEKVTLAVFDCNTPIISAVGHETDTFLCDYAADVRAPTPSAAAELAVPDISEMKGVFDLIDRRLQRAVADRLERENERAGALSGSLRLLSPMTIADQNLHQCVSLRDRLYGAVSRRLSSDEMKLERLSAQLSALSPYSILDRGYAIASDKEGRAVVSVSALSEKQRIRIRFSDGYAEAEIIRVDKNDV